jgi:hypothetical protein
MLKKTALSCCVAAAVFLSTTVAEAATFKTGRFLGNTVVGSQTFAHGLGEIPKAIIFWASPDVGTAWAHYAFGLGVTDGTTSFCSAAGSQDGVDLSNASRGMRNKAICSVIWGETTVAEADLTSWDATNVTINWTTQIGLTGYVNFIAIGGSEVSAKVVNWQAPTVTGNASVTTIGFTPDVVIHGYSGSAVVTTPPFNQTSAHFGWGAMTANGNQWANMVRTIDAAGTTETNRGQQTDSAIYMFGTGVSILKEASFVSMNPDGFTVNFTTTDAAASQIFSLALRGVSAKVGNFNKATAVGAQTVGDVEFQPDVVLLTSFQDIARAAPVAHSRFGIGASDGTTEASTSFSDTNALAGVSSVDQMAKIDKVFIKNDNNTQTVNAEADLTAFTNTGFTLDWTTNDAVATQMLYLALGQGSEAKVLTGSYRGDGTASHFIDVGFVPDFVIVKGGDQTGTNAEVGVFRSSTMSGANSKPAVGALGPAANMIVSIDTIGQGFTVGSDLRVNSNACANGCLYYWTAFKAAPGMMEVGTYAGTGTSTPIKSITGLGFSPELVFIMSAGADEAIQHSSVAANVKNFYDAEFAGLITLGTDGFSVPTGNARANALGTTYHYVAWNAAPGKMVVGTYAGDAGATKDITTVGFESEYLYVHRQGAFYQSQARTAALAQSNVDGNLFFHVWGYGSGRIAALLSNGFRVTNQANVNASGGTFTYYAWKRASQPMIITGDYVGNGAPVQPQAITLNFAPDVVIVKTSGQIAAIRTSTMPANTTKSMTGATAITAAANTDMIETLDSNGFSVGSNAAVNANTIAYYFIAFKAAAGTMKVGTYIGTGAAGNAIRGVGFSPELVFIMRTGASAAIHGSTAFTSSGGDEHTFTNSGGTPGWLTSFDADGFTVATGVGEVNLLDETYHYIAWNEIPGEMKVGSYAGGTPVDNKDVPGVGFEPEYVIVKEIDNEPAIHHPASLGRSVDSSLYFTAAASAPDLIQALQADGFQVGANADVNESNTFVYYAWRRPDPISTGALTAVRLTAFAATRYDRGVLLQWRTGYEIDNLGFHVYREVDGQRTRVTQSLVAGSGLMAGQGAAVSAEKRYAIWDSAGPADASAVYWLEDRDFGGTSTWHGPVTPTQGGLEGPPDVTSSTALTDLGKGQGQKRRKVFLERGGGLERRGKASARTAAVSAAEMQWTLAAQAAVKISVDRPGWYRITQPELVAAGLAPRVNARALRLFVDGVEQAMLITGEADGRFDPADAIEFYGTGLDTPYTDTRVYWLVADSRPGRRLTVHARAGSGAAAVGAGSFDFTLQQKERSIYFAALRNGEAENWFGALVSEEAADLVFDVSNVEAGHAAELEMTIQGVTDRPGGDADHLVAISVNGTEIGELRFDGQALGVQGFAIPAGLLTEGANTVTVVARGGEADFSLVDLVRLRYAHAYRADADLLRFTTDGPGTIKVGGFASRAIRVIDVTDPLAVDELRGVVESDAGLWAVTVGVPGSGPRTLLAFTEATVAAPRSVRANRPSRVHAAASAADYLAVFHAEFADAIAPLVERRQQQGLSVARIDIEDVYDEFSFGEKTPLALKDFVRHARATWKQQPRFLLLVGDATIDPRDYAGFGDADFVPTKQIPLEGVALETASDDWFVDVDDDGLPDVAIGRLPVRTLDQAHAIVAKTLEYEGAADAPWMNDILFVADHDEAQERRDFETASRRLEALLPQAYRSHELFSSQLDADALRQQLASQVAAGRLIVNYSGHGSTQLWGVHGNLLGPDDVNGWSNARLPFVVAMNCLNGLFQGIYDEESLAETLLRAPRGGAVAVWASSGVTDTSKQAVVSHELYRLIFQGIVPTLGETVAAAKRAGADRDVRRSWIFFGDPALQLKGIRPAGATAASSPQVVMAQGTSDQSETNEAQAEPAAAVVRLVDFTGDGRDDLFFHDAERGAWTVAFSDTDLRAVSGQWASGLQVSAARLNGDAAADLVFYRPATGEWTEALNAGPGRFVVRASGTGTPGQQLLLADFTGDGRDDRLMYDPRTGTFAVTTHDQSGDRTEVRRTWPVGVRLYAGDFNGDGFSDVAGHDAQTGSGFLALRSKNDFVVVDTQWGAGWTVTPARLNDLRRTDLVLYNPQTGAARLASSDGRGGFTYQTRTWPAGLAVQAADLEGDGRDDLFGYSPRSGVWWTAAFSSLGITESRGQWSVGWQAATGDLNGDGRTDIVLYDPLSGLGFRFHTVTPGVFDYRPEAWMPGAALIGR